jgi:hypothetical protein
MCMPRLALASWPEMSHVMVVAADSEVCSKVTVPVTLESPRTTATSYQVHGLAQIRSRRGEMEALETRQGFRMAWHDYRASSGHVAIVLS